MQKMEMSEATKQAGQQRYDNLVRLAAEGTTIRMSPGAISEILEVAGKTSDSFRADVQAMKDRTDKTSRKTR